VRRILFVIRGKLGDSLIAYAAVRKYVDEFPGDEVTLLMRRDYARLLKGERGFRLIPFRSRLEMLIKLIVLRAQKPFDVLAVLWGFGPPMRTIAKWTRAKRKIYLDGRFSDAYPEWPGLRSTGTLVDAATDVIRKFEPSFKSPGFLSISSLHRKKESNAIAVVPLANELRRNLDGPGFDRLLAEVRRRHPAAAIRVLVNPSDRGARALLGRALPEGVELVRFSKLQDIVSEYRGISAWYGTDTGLYHLAAAMDIPATVFFGPTQPWKIVMPQQPGATWVRLKVLGEAHCDVTDCANPACVHQAVAAFCRSEAKISVEATPVACPLRTHHEISEITVQRLP
jgi:ADP-heptose:LPS heptosyltransferase